MQHWTNSFRTYHRLGICGRMWGITKSIMTQCIRVFSPGHSALIISYNQLTHSRLMVYMPMVFGCHLTSVRIIKLYLAHRSVRKRIVLLQCDLNKFVCLILSIFSQKTYRYVMPRICQCLNECWPRPLLYPCLLWYNHLSEDSGIA